MSILESIEKLRVLVGEAIGLSENERLPKMRLLDPYAIGRLVDEIESEIPERYIERDKAIEAPLDADGVPWKPSEVSFVDPYGEKRALVSMTYIIDSHSSEIRHWLLEGFNSTNNKEFRADECRHVKPDSLEELLDDVSKDIICYPRERVTGYLEDNHSIGEAVMLDVRDRLRDLLGGDAE